MRFYIASRIVVSLYYCALDISAIHINIQLPSELHHILGWLMESHEIKKRKENTLPHARDLGSLNRKKQNPIPSQSMAVPEQIALV